MREIKFRGKRVDNGEWAYGFFSRINGEPIILSPMDSYKYYRKFFVDVPFKQVIPETVGQYTGLKDKNGKEIFEGDVVLCKIHDKEYMGLVEYTNTYGFYYLSGMGYSDTELWGCNEKKVIGNIHENKELLNPELLEVQE